MADILPYLGVERHFSEDETAGQTQIMEDFSGMTPEQAQKVLKNQGLTAKLSGNSGVVTGQIPSPGQSVPGGSEVLLYLGEKPAQQMTAVPDFTGMNRAQAEEAAGKLGLYLLVAGNPGLSPKVTVIHQDTPRDTQVPAGTTITLTFTDSTAKD